MLSKTTDFDTMIADLENDPAPAFTRLCAEFMPEMAPQLELMLQLVPRPQLRMLTCELVSAFKHIQAGNNDAAIAIADNYGLGDAMRGWIARIAN